MCIFSASVNGGTLPARSVLEVRLLNATGSRISKAGQRVNAIVIAPVFVGGKLMLAPGAVLSGTVDQVERLGFGLRSAKAEVRYRFDQLSFGGGASEAVRSRVVQVEMAKEQVNAQAVIGGVHPTANLSACVSFVVSALLFHPALVAPVVGFKLLIARSPDSEIYFPAGTEMLVELTESSDVPEAPGKEAPEAFSEQDSRSIRQLLDKLPQQQTDRGHNQPSDVVNLLLLGSRSQVSNAFQSALWTGEQRHSVLALYRMYHCIVQRMGYSLAPMTRLQLNGRLPDLMYQKNLNTLAKRHHVRLWDQGWEDAWLGAGTEDLSYEVRHMHVTHASDRAIDNERSKIVNDLWFTGCVETAGMFKRAEGKSFSQDGSSIVTDGQIAVLRLKDCGSESSFQRRPARGSLSLGQALEAIGMDVARSNPASLAVNAIKSIAERRSSLKQDSAGGGGSTAVAASFESLHWIRQSIAVATTSRIPLRSRMYSLGQVESDSR